MAIICAVCPISTSYPRQKELDNDLKWSIINFTGTSEYLRAANERQRCQVPHAPLTGHAESALERGARRIVPSGRVLRPARFGPGQVRDAAPGAIRGQVRDGCGGELRVFPAIVLSSVIGLRARWPCRPGASQTRSKAGAQAHRQSPLVH